jgi:hypothetical protein
LAIRALLRHSVQILHQFVVVSGGELQGARLTRR